MASKTTIPTPEPYSNDRLDNLRVEFDTKITALETKIETKLNNQSIKIDEKVPRHIIYWSVPLLLAIVTGVFGYSFMLISSQSNKFDLLKDRVLILETQRQK